jgi:hypothetical protein
MKISVFLLHSFPRAYHVLRCLHDKCKLRRLSLCSTLCLSLYLTRVPTRVFSSELLFVPPQSKPSPQSETSVFTKPLTKLKLCIYRCHSHQHLLGFMLGYASPSLLRVTLRHTATLFSAICFRQGNCGGVMLDVTYEIKIEYTCKE